MCIDYRKLNKATKKDHFPLPFIDEMLKRLAKHSYFYFLDGYSGYHQIPIHPKIRARPRSHAPMEHIPTDKCHLGYVTHPRRSKGAWCPFSPTWSKKLWKFSWTTSRFGDDLRSLSRKFRQSLAEMPREGPNPQLGEMSVHGPWRHCFRTLSVRKRDRGG